MPRRTLDPQSTTTTTPPPPPHRQYFTYLRGETHITKGLKKITWFRNLQTGSSSRRGAAKITQSPGGALEQAAKAVEERRRTKARRVRLLTNVAVSLGMVEGISSTMTSAMFLITRINPGVVGGEPLDRMYVFKLWAIQMLFELVLPEIVLAILSQKFAKRGEFGDMTQALQRTSKMKNMLITAFTAVTTVCYMHMYFVEALCPAPRDVDGGGGLLSFARCCAKPEDWDDDSSDVYCWMDQHYPVICNEEELSTGKWQWEAECVPSE